MEKPWLPVVSLGLTALAMAGGLVMVYVDGAARDREQDVRIERLQADMTRTDTSAAELRREIRQDLGDIKQDLRALRSELVGTRK